MSQNSLQIFMGRSFLDFNTDIWRSARNLNDVESSQELFKFGPRV